MTSRVRAFASVIAFALAASDARAAPPPSRGPRAAAPAPRPAAPADASGAQAVDRVVVRWYAPETGGIARPRYIFERELAFEARLEAFADPDPDPEATGFRERHVRAALDRHIAEGLLSSLAIVPAPTDNELAARTAVARAILDQRVRGDAHVAAAAAAEGIATSEIDAMVIRQARASIYLDRMVAPMLEPTEAELRDAWKTGATPFKDLPFDRAAPALSRWLVGVRIAQAIDTYYQNARSRVFVAIARHP